MSFCSTKLYAPKYYIRNNDKNLNIMSKKIMIERVLSTVLKELIKTKKSDIEIQKSLIEIQETLKDLTERPQYNKQCLSISDIETEFGLSRKVIDGFRKKGLKFYQNIPNGKILIQRSVLEKFIIKKDKHDR